LKTANICLPLLSLVTKPQSKPDARVIPPGPDFFQSILLTVRGRSTASWRDGGIECANRRSYDRLVTACQEMQTKPFQKPLHLAAERPHRRQLWQAA
jgi:hypothetical protein